MPDTTPEITAALAHCRSMMRAGSKSFSLAARLFAPDIRDAAFFLYGWCRYCDDLIDGAGKECDANELTRRVATLKANTVSAFSSQPQTEPVFIALQHVARFFSIPSHYALELIEGMAMDARGERYRVLDELLVYCYRVAGTVGLMMSHVMGLRDGAALKHAADLGIAMQLTNIARDIIEDAERGRIYIPLDWLAEETVAPDELACRDNRAKLARVSARLLRVAGQYYASGDEGLWHLSFGSACAVASARRVYAGIGDLILARGAKAWDDRAYLGAWRKGGKVVRGVAQVMRSLPARVAQPWSAAPIGDLWRLSDMNERLQTASLEYR